MNAKFMPAVLFFSVFSVFLLLSCTSVNENESKTNSEINDKEDISLGIEDTYLCGDIDFIGELKHGVVKISAGKCKYYVDTSCQKLFGKAFADAYDFRDNGTALVKKSFNGKTQFFLIDINGNEILSLDPSYQEVYHSKSGEYIEVSPNKWSDISKKHGLISTTGEFIIPIDKGSIYITDHWAVVDIGLEKCKFIDLNTGEIVAEYNGQFGGNSEGIVTIMGNQHFFIDSTGQNPFYREYYWTDDFSEGIAKVTDGVDIWFINKKGERAFERTFEFESLNEFQNGFSNGLCPILTDGKWQVIDRTGKTKFTAEYDNVWEYENGYSVIEQNDMFGLINTSGEEIFPCRYEFIISPVCEGLFKYNGDRGITFMSSKGTTYSIVFDLISNFENGVAIGLVDDELKCVYLKDICRELNLSCD